MCFQIIPFFLVLSVILPLPIFASQSNIQLSPPPIPWFEFDKGDKDLKVGGTIIYLTGDSTEGINGDIDVYGGGVNAFYRYAFRDIFAIDFGATTVGAYGNVGNDADMSMWVLSVPVDLELQAVRNDRFVLIFFGGFNFTWSYVGVDYDDGTDTAEFDIWTNMRGPQGGVQLSFLLQDFVLTPFIMLQKLAGTASVDFYQNGSLVYSDDISISSPTATLYGIDIVYQPWNLTLSSLVQQVSSSSDNEGFTTYVFSINYCFHWPASTGEPVEAEEIQ